VRIQAFLIAYPPQARVGAWLATHGLLAHAAKLGHDVNVCTEDRVIAYEHEGVKVEANQAFISQLAQQADITLSHLGDDDRGVKVAMHYDKPHVRMCHGYPPFGAHTLDHYKPPELAVFNSQSMYESFHYDGPSIVCHPVLRPDEFRTTPGDSIGLANNSAEKGAELFDQLARYMPEYHFLGIKAGHGSRYDMHRRNLTTMEKTFNMRDDFYSKIRILLMPSITETWGMVALEAMCSGIPVIAHPTPGLLESCGHAGIFHMRDDLDAWITEIERLHDPDEYAAQSKLCLERADEIANDDSADRFVAALERLVR
jgi:hypothetical protein